MKSAVAVSDSLQAVTGRLDVSLNIIINLNKPKGITSQQAVARIKKLFGARKAGHAGTLDPMATGVLLVFLNEATKISRFLLEKDKTYRFRMKLGEKTDTGDADGRVIETKQVPVLTLEDISRVARQFTGRISQTPPMYSAVKVNGMPLYKLARKGIETKRSDRQVDIFSLQVTGLELPYVDMTVSCSKGTYIRTLCEDIGLRLGTGAHITMLERTAVGTFSVLASIALDRLTRAELKSASYLYSADEALSDYPDIMLNEADYAKARNGIAMSRELAPQLAEKAFIKLKNPSGEFFAIASAERDKIVVERILNL